MKWFWTPAWWLLFGRWALALQPPAGQDVFRPIPAGAPVEQLPAAPLLIGAYVFVWIVVFFYVWTIGRRLNKVEAEMRSLAERQRRRSGTA